jgi:hypothetical protein
MRLIANKHKGGTVSELIYEEQNVRARLTTKISHEC